MCHIVALLLAFAGFTTWPLLIIIVNIIYGLVQVTHFISFNDLKFYHPALIVKYIATGQYEKGSARGFKMCRRHKRVAKRMQKGLKGLKHFARSFL